MPFRFGADGVQAVVSLFALVGLYMMLLALPTVIALVRHRALIPLMYLVWIIAEVGKIALLIANPITRSTALPSGAVINRVSFCSSGSSCRCLANRTNRKMR